MRLIKRGSEALGYLLLSTLLISCGGADSISSETGTEDDTQKPANIISRAYLIDLNSEVGRISGQVAIETAGIEQATALAESVQAFWADREGNKIGGVFYQTRAQSVYQFEFLEDVAMPEGAEAILLHPANAMGLSPYGSLLIVHDFIGNAQLSGAGGNELESWRYGDERPKISLHRQDDGLCIFDNGRVSVIDMNNSRDRVFEANRGAGVPNNADDHAFPPYSFACDEEPIHNERPIVDEVGVWTYSTLNDALFYGDIVYDSFVAHLGEPPLEEKLRLRVHYGNQFDVTAYWDGTYANFTDGYLTHYSLATLDIIAHEIAHGVLDRISALKIYGQTLGADARTLHEAFGDISGVMAKYYLQGSQLQGSQLQGSQLQGSQLQGSQLHGELSWVHGEESNGDTRRLDAIVTEAGAIPSFLDYDEAGDNFYKRIGMITYPFYLLANNLGLEAAYRIYLQAAKACWEPETSLVGAARCIESQAESNGQDVLAVVAAFKAVKIDLLEGTLLSHFVFTKNGLNVSFSDDSRHTQAQSNWRWDFGDGTTSDEINPEHSYAEAGDYEVRLVVTADGIEDSFQRLVSVSE